MKRAVLWVAKVPAEPEPPTGSPGSIRVFRPALNFWKYLLVRWGFKQASGAIALFFFLSMTAGWQAAVSIDRALDRGIERAIEGKGKAAEPAEGERKQRRNRALSNATQRVIAGWIHDLEMIGLAFFLIQMPFALAAARLDYEMRWYMVTDRSMRLREGIFKVREMTLTFANVQNITIRQGPLQRLLGIADVVVRTAGGGGSDASGDHTEEKKDATHTGVLRAVDNAESVRDMILDRLRRLRDAGLGDPDDRQAVAHPGILDAARELRSAIAGLKGQLLDK
jgi:membrane protein YdbS with pleckstrin-like domain